MTLTFKRQLNKHDSANVLRTVGTHIQHSSYIDSSGSNSVAEYIADESTTVYIRSALASLYASTDSDIVAIVLFLIGADEVNYPVDSWTSGKSFEFWQPLQNWEKEHYQLKIVVNPILSDPPIEDYNKHPVGELLKEFEELKSLSGDIGNAIYPFIYRAKYQGLLNAAKLESAHFAAAKKIAALQERGDYSSPLLAAFAQGICNLPKQTRQYGESRVYW